MKELFDHLDLTTYEELKELYLYPIGRDEFTSDEIEDWMRELPDFVEPDEIEDDYGPEEGEIQNVTIHVLDEEHSKEILTLLVEGNIRRDEAIAQLSKNENIPIDQVNQILKELDL